MPSLTRAAFRIAANVVSASTLLAACAASAATQPIGISEITYASVQTEANSNLLCMRGIEKAVLRDDGSVAVERRGCAFDLSIPNFLTDVRSIEGSGFGQAPRTFAIRNDSTLVGWGDTRCGLLGNEEVVQRYRAAPVEIPLRTVT